MVHFEKGKILEGFVIIPTLSLHWLLFDHKNRYLLQISFLRWYVCVWFNATNEMVESFKR